MSETVGYEVVVRFHPGAEAEAEKFARAIVLPDQAQWKRFDRLVAPKGEASRHSFFFGFDADIGEADSAT